MTTLQVRLLVSCLAAAIVVIGCDSGERHLKVTATAFNSTRAQTDRNPTQAACGEQIAPGDRIVAVSPDLVDKGLKCGTKLEVSGLAGSWTVLDRMPAQRKLHIDLYMGNDVRAARKWGSQQVEIRWKEPRE